MTIDGIPVHKSVSSRRILAAVKLGHRTLCNPGICLACGADADGVEPDARRYECEGCGRPAVYGAEELMFCHPGNWLG